MRSLQDCIALPENLHLSCICALIILGGGMLVSSLLKLSLPSLAMLLVKLGTCCDIVDSELQANTKLVRFCMAKGTNCA